jgi:hypothetical protein
MCVKYTELDDNQCCCCCCSSIETEHCVMCDVQVEVAAPEIGNCLLGRAQQQQCQEVTALTTGRLLHTFIANMATAAAHNNATRAAADAQEDSADSTSDSSSTASDKAGAVTARRLLVAADATAAALTSSSGGGAVAAGIATAAYSSEGSDAADSEQRPQSPRLMLFSAHDTTILPLLSALGQHQNTWPGFTSNLAIELWGHKGKYFVRVLQDGEPLKLPLIDPSQLQGEGGGSSKLASQAPSGPKNLQEGSAEFQFMGAIHRLVAVVEGWVRGAVSAVDAWLDELGVLIAQAVGGRGTAVSAGRLQSNGQGVYNTAAYVVTLDEFQQRVVQDYVMGQEQYAAACGGGNAAGVQMLDDMQAKRRWHAQFY